MTNDEIAELAEDIAQQYFPANQIDPLMLIERLGITWSLGNYQDAFDGLIEFYNGSFHIYLNRDRLHTTSSPRARFTASHELGHYFIDEHRNSLIRTNQSHPSFVEMNSDIEIEQQADWFASNFLMPERRFKKQAKKCNRTADSITKLSIEFKTSAESTAIRFAKTHDATLSTMYWTEQKRKWCWSSEKAFELTKNWAHKGSNKVPSGSLTARALHGGDTVDPAEYRGSTLSMWFPGIKQGSYKDRVCKESVLVLGNYGVVTVLDIDE